MRLPVIPSADTKDGVTNKNARMTNMLKETKSISDVAALRPGLVETALLSGNGNGLVRFNDKLISVFGQSAIEGFPVQDTDIIYYFPFAADLLDTQENVFGEFAGTPQLPIPGSVDQVSCGLSSAKFQSNPTYLGVDLFSDDPTPCSIGTADFTIEFKIYPSTAFDFFNFKISSENEDSEITSLAVTINPGSNSLTVFIENDDVEKVNISHVDAGVIVLGDWIDIALVRDGATFTAFVNGAVADSASSADCSLTFLPPSEDFSRSVEFLLTDSSAGTGTAYLSNFLFTQRAKYSAAYAPSCSVTSSGLTIIGTVVSGFYDFAQGPL